MKKLYYTSSIITLSFLLFSSITQAANIFITIEGSGEITTKGGEASCTQDCTISNSLTINTLVPTPNSNWKFMGWSGQQCDSGAKVIVTESYKAIGDAAAGGAKTLKTSDLNGDTLEDLVSISLFNGEITFRENQGNGQFETTIIDSDLKYPTALDLFDWDDDNDKDLLVAEYGRGIIKVYKNNGLGLFTFFENISIKGIKPYSFKVIDKNNDNKKDFIISSFNADITGDLWKLVSTITSQKLQWYINKENQYLPEVVLSSNAAMTIDAYKNGGDVSVVTAEILKGEIAHYHLGKRTVVDTGRGSYGTAFGDIDKDGIMDILAAHYEPSVFNLIYGKNDGNFSPPQLIIAPKNGVTAASFGDYNSDGLIDIATSEFNKKQFYYFATQSYEECVISTEADISLTATFIKDPNGGSSSSETLVLTEINDTSSGGTIFYLPFFVLWLIYKRKQY